MNRLGIALLSSLVGVATGCAGSNRACRAGAHADRATPFALSATDRTCLQAYEWRADAEPDVGVVVLVHGIRDHASRYDALAHELERAGFAVYAHDMRGHGYSGGHRQRFDSIDQLLGDLELVVREARARHPGKPLFLYGHSLGGLVATHYASRHQDELAGLVLSGAALKFPRDVTAGQLRAARFFSAILPNLPAQPVDDHGFVSTPAAQAEYMHDPVIDHAKLPARSARAGADGIRDVAARLAGLRLPLYIMHGGADRQTNIDGSRALYAAAASDDKKLVILDGQYHDLLHEPVRDRVIAEVTSWLTTHVTASARRTAPTYESRSDRNR